MVGCAAPPKVVAAPATTSAAARETPAQFEIESNFFVVAENDIPRLPESVRSRLAAAGGRNKASAEQTLDGEEGRRFVEAMNSVAAPMPAVPPLKLFEGESTSLSVRTQQAYVDSLTVVSAPGAALFDPTVSTIDARGIQLTFNVGRAFDGHGSQLGVQGKLTRLLSLIPVTESMSVKSLKNPGEVQVVSGTYQVPVVSNYEVSLSGRNVPDGRSILLACFLQKIGTGATTQPALTSQASSAIDREHQLRVFVLLKPTLVAPGHVGGQVNLAMIESNLIK